MSKRSLRDIYQFYQNIDIKSNARDVYDQSISDPLSFISTIIENDDLLNINEDLFSNIKDMDENEKEIFFDSISSSCIRTITLVHEITKKYNHPIMVKCLEPNQNLPITKQYEELELWKIIEKINASLNTRVNKFIKKSTKSTDAKTKNTKDFLAMDDEE